MAHEAHLIILKKGVKVWNRWRIANPGITPDLRRADLSNANLGRANLSRANLRGVNLSSTNLSRANLIGVDLRGSNLTGANLRGALLKGANFSNAYLLATNLSRTNLTTATLRQADFIAVNLKNANLYQADLSGSDLSGSDLREAIFKEANLTNANLSRTQALTANFINATFTGACLENWHINSTTKLYDVTCNYVYLKRLYIKKRDQWVSQERLPKKGTFTPKEFSQQFQVVAAPVDLIFMEGIDWSAFLTAFDRLRAEQRFEREEEEDADLSIQAIESRNDGAFLIRIKVPSEFDQMDIEEDFRQKYEAELKHRNSLLQVSDEQISLYQEQVQLKRQKGTEILEIIKTMAHEAVPKCDLRDAKVYAQFIKRLGPVT